MSKFSIFLYVVLHNDTKIWLILKLSNWNPSLPLNPHLNLLVIGMCTMVNVMVREFKEIKTLDHFWNILWPNNSFLLISICICYTLGDFQTWMLIFFKILKILYFSKFDPLGTQNFYRFIHPQHGRVEQILEGLCAFEFVWKHNNYIIIHYI